MHHRVNCKQDEQPKWDSCHIIRRFTCGYHHNYPRDNPYWSQATCNIEIHMEIQTRNFNCDPNCSKYRDPPKIEARQFHEMQYLEQTKRIRYDIQSRHNKKNAHENNSNLDLATSTASLSAGGRIGLLKTSFDRRGRRNRERGFESQSTRRWNFQFIA